ncbi:hypothetical protein [Camelimonas fluminis]|nr:hypothetical protein [Camelimonas fluminis]
MRDAIRSHRLRAAALALTGLALAAFVFTTSMPLALAERHPRLSLLLSPHNAKALVALAREARNTGGAPSAPAAQETPSEQPEEQHAGAWADLTAAEQPVPPADQGAPRSDGSKASDQKRRDTILKLAAQAIRKAPLNAEAYRLIGEAATDDGQARQSMTDALARSRREAIAALWLAHHAYERGDWSGVIQMADTIFRARPSLNRFVAGYLNFLTTIPEGREKLTAALKAQPSWRLGFLRGLGTQLAGSDAPLALFQQMKQAGDTLTDQELVPFLDAHMRATKSATSAYNIWLQLLPVERLETLKSVNNLDFSTEPGGLPFDWRVASSRGVYVDFQRHVDKPGRALHLRFGVGQLKFGGISQVIFLTPGHYRFEGRQQGRMTARRGMRWRIACFPGARVVGESDQLMGAPRDARNFYFDVVVPDDPACEAQTVRLLHDARSPSEQYASGDITFDQLKIGRLPDPAARE